MTQFVGIIALCKAYGIDEQESLLVVHDVATDFLAEGCRIAPHVKHVVPELECQTHVHTGIIEQVGLLFIGIGDEGTGLEGATQQDRRLEADHVDIFLDSDVDAVLVVHVPLLSLVNLDGGLVEQVHYLPVGSAGNILSGDSQHRVTAQDGRVGVPAAVHGGLATAHVGIVHHVVVQQGEVVEHLQSHSGIQRVREFSAHRFTSHEREHRADALATQRHVIGNGLIELTRSRRIRNCGNRLIDGLEVFLECFHMLEFISFQFLGRKAALYAVSKVWKSVGVYIVRSHPMRSLISAMSASGWLASLARAAPRAAGLEAWT